MTPAQTRKPQTQKQILSSLFILILRVTLVSKVIFFIQSAAEKQTLVSRLWTSQIHNSRLNSQTNINGEINN